ncbi:TonB-dependent receptor domain-containing protein [Massilia oculi]|uniref:TonB-dependent receptor domain-containing protein n=1 Tax=Massilia oculi TaxID=945844 RepID=UPI003619CCEF
MSLMDDKVLVNVGLRHQRIKDFGYDYNTGLENSAYESSENTPFAAIVYKPRKDLSVYANYSEGLQRGPVASGTDIVNQGEIFAPYVARQREAGVKYDSGRYGLSAAVFSTSQPSAYVENRVFGVFGEQRNRGLELSVFGTPARGLKLLGGLTLIDAEQRVTAGGVNQGKKAIGVPETQLNIGADWIVPGVDGLSLNARTVYTSKQYADGANLQKLPSWTRLDLGATWNTRFMDRDLTCARAWTTSRTRIIGPRPADIRARATWCWRRRAACRCRRRSASEYHRRRRPSFTAASAILSTTPGATGLSQRPILPCAVITTSRSSIAGW